jgi:hypothetical protein
MQCRPAVSRLGRTEKEMEPPDNFLLLNKFGLFILCRLSTDWMRHIHLIDSNILAQVYPFKCVLHPEKHPSRWHIMTMEYKKTEK